MGLFKINFNYTYVVRSKHNVGKMVILLITHARVPCSATTLNVQCDSIARGKEYWVLSRNKKVLRPLWCKLSVYIELKYCFG